MKKKVGQVTETERDKIKKMFERQNGLNELKQILTPDNAELYEKLVSDISSTESKFNDWWDTMSREYQWEASEKGNWIINFENGEVYLEK